MRLVKQQVILHHVVTNDRKAMFSEHLDEPGVQRRFSLAAGDWTALGGPEVITVTVEPGDRLNEASNA